MKPTSKAIAKIANWMQEAPAESEALRLTAKRPLGGDQLLVEIQITELAEKTPQGYAEYLVSQCEQWADTLNRECSFLLQWLAGGERPLATLQFRCGPFDANAVPIDGSPESFLLQLQATTLQKDKMLLEMVRTMSEGYRGMIELLSDRLVTLERDRSSVEAQRAEIVKSEADLLTDAQDNERFKYLVGLAEKLLQAGAAAQGQGQKTG